MLLLPPGVQRQEEKRKQAEEEENNRRDDGCAAFPTAVFLSYRNFGINNGRDLLSFDKQSGESIRHF